MGATASIDGFELGSRGFAPEGSRDGGHGARRGGGDGPPGGRPSGPIRPPKLRRNSGRLGFDIRLSRQVRTAERPGSLRLGWSQRHIQTQAASGPHGGSPSGITVIRPVPLRAQQTDMSVSARQVTASVS